MLRTVKCLIWWSSNKSWEYDFFSITLLYFCLKRLECCKHRYTVNWWTCLKQKSIKHSKRTDRSPWQGFSTLNIHFRKNWWTWNHIYMSSLCILCFGSFLQQNVIVIQPIFGFKYKLHSILTPKTTAISAFIYSLNSSTDQMHNFNETHVALDKCVNVTVL